jgi:parallel beta-helix repeat protein
VVANCESVQNEADSICVQEQAQPTLANNTCNGNKYYEHHGPG